MGPVGLVHTQKFELNTKSPPASGYDRCQSDLLPGFSKSLVEEPTSAEDLKAMLVPCPDEVLELWSGNRQKIGNVRNNSRDLAARYQSATPREELWTKMLSNEPRRP